MPLGPGEIAIILVIVLLFFGPKKLPELFRSFGKSIQEFKKASSELDDDIRKEMDSEISKPTSNSTSTDEPNKLSDSKDT